MELSKQIKDARAKLGLSQSQAAKAWSVPVRTLQQWEQAKQLPRGFALAKLREIIEAAMAAKPASPCSASLAPDAPAGQTPAAKLPKEKRRRRSRKTS